MTLTVLSNLLISSFSNEEYIKAGMPIPNKSAWWLFIKGKQTWCQFLEAHFASMHTGYHIFSYGKYIFICDHALVYIT